MMPTSEIRCCKPALVSVLALLLLMPGCGKETAREPSGTNVLIITIDTTRADYLGCYGSPDVKTPVLDRLAASGVQFMHCIAPSQCTNPSHCSIMTGLALARHGVYDNEETLTGAAITLAEVFQAQGYATLGAVSARHLNAKHCALDQGFGTFLDCTAAAEMTADQRNELFLKELRYLKDKPFFAWLHYYDPHHTYDPAPPYDTMYEPAPAAGRLPTRMVKGDKKAPDTETVDVDSLVALYKGEISYTDNRLGRVLATLEDMGVAGNTLVLVIADHGESLIEKGIYCKHGGLFNQTLHVPFIMRQPALVPAGLKIEANVQSTDVFPTVLALAGLPNPVKDLTGRDLTPLFKKPGRKIHDYIVAEAVDGVIQTVHQGGYKFIKPNPKDWTTKEKFLFRNFDDYWETENLLAEHPQLGARLEKLLDDRVAADQAKALPQVEGQVMDPETIKALKALGYVN